MSQERVKYKPGENIVTLTDSYKFSHNKQYPPNTTKIYSYFESRGGFFEQNLFFGLQYQLMEYLTGKVVDQKKIDYAAERAKEHMSANPSFKFNREGWEHILDVHDGRLPISIRAVPEGTVVPYKNVLITVENTDPKSYWLTNDLESLIVQSWYPTTVATQSMYMKKLIADALDKTGTPLLLDFKLHDFGLRGSTSVESAAIGGAAHLVNFKGTDTFVAIELLDYYYNGGMAGFSIPAAEHSTITSWGREHEADAMRNMLKQYPDGLVSVPSDSYDIFYACREIWGGALHDEVMKRKGTLVVRPDSGDPPKIISEVIEILGEKFGCHVNDKGYKVLNDKVRIIQGDGIDYEMIQTLLRTLEEAKWSADNLTFGSGGALLQKVNRDTMKFAFKCSSATVDGVEIDVSKNPITDPGKNSKVGTLKLLRSGDSYVTVRQSAPGKDELVEVFRDGKLLVKYDLPEIRARAQASMQRIGAKRV